MVTLGQAARRAGYRSEHLSVAGSTNAELMDRVAAGERGPLWLLADRQEQGRGRNGRGWTSPPGNLYASLLVTDPAPPVRVSELSFVLSVALRDAVLAAAGFVDSDRLRLKWPNDLMIDGRKTAGLLLEGGRTADGSAFVVAGFGVNIESFPDGTTHPATSLVAASLAVGRDALFAALTDAVANRIAQWQRGDGFAGLRNEWLLAAHGRGEIVRVNTVAESFDGTFDTIDATGRLVVSTPTGPRLVSAGDVFVLGTSA